MTVAIVIGTGRSGTSLAMQALDALGFPVVGDAVPAGENNLRGTGEAVELRDAMFRLHRSLGGPRGFLPDGWQNTSVACDTREWLTRYLSVGAADEGQQNLALKFPLSSLFLPLLRDAVREAAVEPVWIWATRPPAEVIASLMRAYHSTVENATATWVQRTFYLLRDSPDDTHLLPFGTWRENSTLRSHIWPGRLVARTANGSLPQKPASLRASIMRSPMRRRYLIRPPPHWNGSHPCWTEKRVASPIS